MKWSLPPGWIDGDPGMLDNDENPTTCIHLPTGVMVRRWLDNSNNWIFKIHSLRQDDHWGFPSMGAYDMESAVRIANAALVAWEVEIRMLVEERKAGAKA